MTRYLKDNEDFQFPSDFGFHGSNDGNERKGRNKPTIGPLPEHEGDGTLVSERIAKAKGGRVRHYDQGGAVNGVPFPSGGPQGGGMPPGGSPGGQSGWGGRQGGMPGGQGMPQGGQGMPQGGQGMRPPMGGGWGGQGGQGGAPTGKGWAPPQGSPFGQGMPQGGGQGGQGQMPQMPQGGQGGAPGGGMGVPGGQRPPMMGAPGGMPPGGGPSPQAQAAFKHGGRVGKRHYSEGGDVDADAAKANYRLDDDSTRQYARGGKVRHYDQGGDVQSDWLPPNDRVQQRASEVPAGMRGHRDETDALVAGWNQEDHPTAWTNADRPAAGKYLADKVKDYDNDRAFDAKNGVNRVGPEYVKAKGGKVRHYDQGGDVQGDNPMENATVSLPASDAAKLARNLVSTGRSQGQVEGAQRALAYAQRGIPEAAREGRIAQPRPQPPAQSPLQGVPGARGIGQPVPNGQPVAGTIPISASQGGHGITGPIPPHGITAADGGFIKGAVKHPGRMQEGAKREGVSTHRYMEEHEGSKGSLGSAARLGLRLTGGDLAPNRKK